MTVRKENIWTAMANGFAAYDEWLMNPREYSRMQNRSKVSNSIRACFVNTT